MKLQVNVWQYTKDESYNNGLVTLSLPNSGYDNDQRKLRTDFLGVTTLDIQEPKKKILVYQYLYKNKSGDYGITSKHYYSIENAQNNINSELVVIYAIKESEKEIKV